MDYDFGGVRAGLLDKKCLRCNLIKEADKTQEEAEEAWGGVGPREPSVKGPR